MNSKRKVLVIDDEEDICFLLQRILEKTGLYEVQIANDGEAGCEACMKFKPELVFVDYIMPRVKGDEVVKFIHERLGELEIGMVLMSGLAESCYSSKTGLEWTWHQQDVTVETPSGVEIQHCKWKVPPQILSDQLGIKAVLSKPFHKATLLTLAEHISKKTEGSL